MRELETEYGDRVYFNVIPAAGTLEAQDKIHEFGFHDAKHGLVAFGASGEVRDKAEGHNYGKDRVEEAILKAIED